MSRPALRWESLAASAIVAFEALVRLGAGEPYPGATGLLLLACGLALVPWLPRTLAAPSVRLALLPALALGSFAIVVTTASIVGVPLTELSLRLAAGAIVIPLGAAQLRWPRRLEPGGWSRGKEGRAVALLVAVFAFAFASSWDIVGPFPPRGTDWGHYLLYAEEVAEQRSVLADDRYFGDEQVFADAPAIGVLYGSVLILDGVSSRSLGSGVVVASALSTVSVYALGAGLWGIGAGVLASAAYAVAPAHLEPLYWYGLATTLALVFLPAVALALGLLFRSRREWETVALLAVGLVALAAAHSTSAVIVGVFLTAALLVDLGRWLVVARARAGEALRSSWHQGLIRPVGAAIVAALVLGAGVLAHLARQSRDLGSPVSYEFFEPDWLDLDAISFYFSWAFLATAAVSAVLVLSSARLRRDPALLVLLALALSSVAVTQLWRVEFPFEYRRAVYSFGLALAVLIGVASLRFTRPLWWVVGYGVALVYIAHISIGFRLPERLVSGPDERSAAVTGLDELRSRLDSGELPETDRIVADRCLHFIVPYLVRRPTLAAFEEWQVGYESRVPLAKTAARVLEGGEEGKRLARVLGIGYAVVDPTCTPRIAERLGGTTVIANEDVTIVRLPASAS